MWYLLVLWNFVVANNKEILLKIKITWGGPEAGRIVTFHV